MEQLRCAGPGKFNLIIDEAVYAITLDGCDEELGDQTNGEWYGLVIGDLTPTTTPTVQELNETELLFLKSQAGAIITENSEGFVTVAYFKSLEALEAAWSALEFSFSEDEDEDEEPDEPDEPTEGEQH